MSLVIGSPCGIEPQPFLCEHGKHHNCQTIEISNPNEKNDYLLLFHLVKKV